MRLPKTTHLMLTLYATLAAALPAYGVETSREDQFKAAYLFNFVKFVEWPASVDENVLTICFLGGRGVYESLGTGIESKRVGARHLATRWLDKSATAVGCNVLYMDAEVIPDPSEIPGPAGLPILTVSNAKSFAIKGGMIELFTTGNRLRFNINVDNAQQAGLHISSDLLRLAAAVEKARP